MTITQSWVIIPSVELFVVAGILAGLGVAQWLASGPRVGDLQRTGLGVFLGYRATRKVGWFKTDDRGVYVHQRTWAYALLVLAVICSWLGFLDAVIG